MDEIASTTIDHETSSGQKVDELWFEDGNVVVQAGKKRFRVYKGILSARSTVFKDMFAIPQSGVSDNTEENEQKTPFIRLPDEETDVYCFLLAIFDASFYNPPPAVYCIKDTFSILRLAHKYDVPFLRKWAIAHLTIFFPLDMEALLGILVAKPANTTVSLQSHLEMILLARVADVPWIIPSVLGLLTWRYRLSDITSHAIFPTLAPDVQSLIAQFREQYAYGFGRWSQISYGISSQALCRKHGCVTIHKLIWDAYKVFPWTAGDIKTSLSDYDMEIDGRKLCKDCDEGSKTARKEFFEIEWNKYPAICGFTGWKQLAEMKNSSMND